MLTLHFREKVSHLIIVLLFLKSHLGVLGKINILYPRSWDHARIWSRSIRREETTM